MSTHGSCGCHGECRGECGAPPTAMVVTNPSGLPQLAYRVGTFQTFRRALLAHLPGETELDPWRPTASTDLGLQVVDWWAYLADVLTFYNERIANEHYLGTAVLDTSVCHLVALLGYRPRPGLGARATLAVVASTPAPLVVAQGLAVASKAVPGIESQTFEATRTMVFDPPTSVVGPTPDDLTTTAPTAGPPPSSAPGAAQAPPHLRLVARGGVLVKGVPTGLRVGDRLLLRAKAWGSADAATAVVSVTGLVTEKDPSGRKNTRVLLDGTGGLPSSAVAGDYSLARSRRAHHLASMPAGAAVVTATSLVLDGAARDLVAGDPLLVERPGAGVGTTGGAFTVVRLGAYAEEVWYADASAATPKTRPSDTSIPLVVARLTVGVRAGVSLTSVADPAGEVTVRSGWADVGALLDTPVATVTALPGRLTLARPPAARAGEATPALVQDAHGRGATVALTPVAGTSDVVVSGAGGGSTSGAGALAAPLTVLWDLVEVTRGETVRDELLGTGRASLPGQDFPLAKSPVTFLADQPGRSGDGWSSTVELRVGGRYWTEVPALYGHGPDETIFETRVDSDGVTHVITPDGEHGRRLPTGAQVVATYRVGSGAAVPPPGALTQVLSAVPNLRAIRNPVAPSGGADPEPAADVRRLAPRSVLTFGRAVSADDYAVVAAAAPGVRRASSEVVWDAGLQRPAVTVWVGDDDAAVAAARTALAAQADPNRTLVVLPAVRLRARLRLTVAVDATFVADTVRQSVVDALLDDVRGLFAPGVRRLGETLYRSEIEKVVTDVPGVLSSAGIRLFAGRGAPRGTFGGRRGDLGDSAAYRPGRGGFFALAADDLTVEVSA